MVFEVGVVPNVDIRWSCPGDTCIVGGEEEYQDSCLLQEWHMASHVKDPAEVAVAESIGILAVGLYTFGPVKRSEL